MGCENSPERMFTSAVINGDLVALAPADLPNHRVKRYKGDDLALPVSEFVAEDQLTLRKIYTFLQRLFELLKKESPARERLMESFVAEQNLSTFIEAVQELGHASFSAHPSERLAKVIHDVRGGGLAPLLGQLQLWSLDGERAAGCDALYFLTRDHLKIMRNALLGLDDPKREEDLQTKIHDTDFIVQKWQGARLHSGEGQKTLEVDCPKSVAISECCVEFGALDRVLYNLLNNACRHGAGNRIHLAIFRVPEEEGRNLRFVLLNALSEEDETRLRSTNLQSLFESGVSTTGSGYGLNVAAEFVAHAYGIAQPEEAVAQSYLGAKLLAHRFAIWFHWPIVTDC